MSHRPIALIASVVIHLVLGVSVAATAGWMAGGRPRVIQINGTPQPRGAGRDLLFDILRADSVAIRLVSTEGDDAVGLGWWSPTVGLWLAVDRMPARTSHQPLRVTLQVGNDAATVIGPIRINDAGSGRIVTAWANTPPTPGTSITLAVSERDSWWHAADPSIVLSGQAEMRNFEVRSQK